MIDPKLVKILACPKCKKNVNHNKQEDILICPNCKLAYEIRDDIPIMLIEQAQPINMEC